MDHAFYSFFSSVPLIGKSHLFTFKVVTNKERFMLVILFSICLTAFCSSFPPLLPSFVLSWSFSYLFDSLLNLFYVYSIAVLGFPGGSDGKKSAYNASDPGSVPGLRRPPGEGNGNLHQYSCLENSIDRGTW